jgi:hypothetical protein
MIIDAHTHCFPPGLVLDRRDALEDPQFRLLYEDPSSSMVDGGGLATWMDSEGIDGTVALSFPWTIPDMARHQNDYMATLVAGDTNIYPFGCVPLEKGIDMERRVSEIVSLGLYGIGEVAFYHTGFGPEEADWLDHLSHLAGINNLPVSIHVSEPAGHSYPGKYDSDLNRLVSLLMNHPGTTFILAHWGGGLPFYELMPEIGRASGNWYYDTAATPFLYYDTIYRIVTDLVGPERILFGTDYPLLGLHRYLPGLETLGSREREMIEAGNITGLLNL